MLIFCSPTYSEQVQLCMCIQWSSVGNTMIHICPAVLACRPRHTTNTHLYVYTNYHAYLKIQNNNTRNSTFSTADTYNCIYVCNHHNSEEVIDIIYSGVGWFILVVVVENKIFSTCKSSNASELKKNHLM